MERVKLYRLKMRFMLESKINRKGREVCAKQEEMNI
jgi:hypothetical protein